MKPRKPRKQRPLKRSFVRYDDGKLIISAPVKVVSEANSREHWSKRNARKRQQQLVTMAHLRSYMDWPKDRVRTVELVRFGMRKLDSDNLAGAYKVVRDAIATCLGVDDGDERVQYRYSQVAPCTEDGIEIRFMEGQ